MFERFRSIFFVSGILFFAIPFVFLLLPPIRQLAMEKPPSGVFVRPYSEEELQGRKIYIREGCWYCHSQFVRPVDFEEARYGEKSEGWEHRYDLPQLYGTRRIGPDLAREGGKRSDDWHFAHLFSPQSVVKNSIMPAYAWFFNGDPTQPNEEAHALVAYLQALGRGKFKKTEEVSLSGGIETSEILIPLGKVSYANQCATCHGEKGDGKGAVASALKPPPRNFLAENFKFGEKPEDVFKTITQGVPGTAMPPFSSLSEKERKALVTYILYLRKTK